MKKRPADAHAQEHGWVLFRIAGWGLLVIAQVVFLARVLAPRSFDDPDLSWILPVVAIAGTLIVAYGFERFVRAGHRRARLREPGD